MIFLSSVSRFLAAVICVSFLLGSQLVLATSNYPIRQVQNPPTYLATLGTNTACNTPYGMAGYEPDDNETHPLYLVFGGTDFDGNPPGTGLDSELAYLSLSTMAARGYAAFLVDYDDDFNLATANEAGLRAKLSCMFDSTSPDSAITKLCARSNVDCSKGIATQGHSQGGALALGASQYDSRVSASSVSGVANQMGPYSILPFNRIFLINSEYDFINNSLAGRNAITGLNCTENDDTCLRADGSGWVFVRQSQLEENTADHCWSFRTECGANGEYNIEPTWWDEINPPTYAYSLVTTADWLAEAATAPRVCPARYVALKSKANNLFVSARLWTAGIPLQANALVASWWETFACLEMGNGNIALQAVNGNFVFADATNGQKLSATTNTTPGAEGTFTYINLGNNTIALQGSVTGTYVDVKVWQSGELIMDGGSIAQTAEFEIIAK